MNIVALTVAEIRHLIAAIVKRTPPSLTFLLRAAITRSESRFTVWIIAKTESKPF